MSKRTHAEAIAAAASFYRANPHRFVKDFLHIDLKWFQKILIYAMNMFAMFAFIGSRGLGKSFLIAIYCCVRCVLYPGTKICIASGTRGQAQVVLEKIKNEILPRSEELRAELDGDIKVGANESIAQFKNTSYIKVVTSSDSSRGNRATVLILDEARMIDKETIDTVLAKFLTTSRQPGYLSNPKYAHLKAQERNRQVYLSSAFFKDHWFYDRIRAFAKNMLYPERSWFLCGLPYQLALKEGLFNRDDIYDQLLAEDFNELKFQMEMESLFYGDSDGSFYDFETIARNRKIRYPWLPDKFSSMVQDGKSFRIPPKQPGEIRILSADIALMSSRKNRNDATAIFINQMAPTKIGRYVNNIVYTETHEGLHTSDQALVIRRLFDEYSCDYLVIDVKGIGLGVADTLVRDIIDSETGELYPALSCCNDDEWARRCQNPNAPKVIWVINGNAKFNSDCAVMLREGFNSGKIRLLVNEFDSETILSNTKGYKALNPACRAKFELPYINTSLLINELINLQHDDSSGYVRVFEKSGFRKDRYSSLSYNYWVANQLEAKAGRRAYNRGVTEEFVFRAPITKKSTGRK